MSESIDAMSLPSAREWARGIDPVPTVLDLIGFETKMLGVAATMNLFWPRLIEVRGCVLLPWVYVDNSFEEWWKKLDGDSVKIESAINHLHLWDVFDESDENNALLDSIGHRLETTWTAHALELFPGSELRAVYSNDEREYGPTVYLSRHRTEG